MEFHYFILYLSALVWIFPIFRQYKTKYFIFFLALGTADLFSEALKKFDLVETNLHVVIISYISYLGVLDKTKLRKYWYIYTIVFVPFIIVNLITSNIFQVFSIIIIDLAILLSILTDFYNDIVDDKEINLFFVVFILYQVSSVVKMFNVITYTFGGLYYFVVMLAFQILIGIFFSFYRPDKPKIAFPLKSN